MVAAHIRVHGERFGLELCNDGSVSLVHPKWSLIGCGEGLAEAQEDLFREARALGEAMLGQDPATLSHEARRMRDYVVRFIGTTGLTDETQP